MANHDTTTICGGVAHEHNESFLYRYARSLGACTNTMTKLWVIIKRFELSFGRNFKTIYIEFDLKVVSGWWWLDAILEIIISYRLIGSMISCISWSITPWHMSSKMLTKWWICLSNTVFKWLFLIEHLMLFLILPLLRYWLIEAVLLFLEASSFSFMFVYVVRA